MKKALLTIIGIANLIIQLYSQTSIHLDDDRPMGTGAPDNVPCAIDINNNVVSFPWYIPPTARTAGNTIPTSTCGSFTLIFEDVVNNTGQGYDGAQGGQMQAVACAVFQYISDVFSISGNPEVVFSQAYTNPQSSGLASGVSIYNSTNTSGFVNCYMQDHAISGSDPDPGSPD